MIEKHILQTLNDDHKDLLKEKEDLIHMPIHPSKKESIIGFVFSSVSTIFLLFLIGSVLEKQASIITEETSNFPLIVVISFLFSFVAAIIMFSYNVTKKETYFSDIISSPVYLGLLLFSYSIKTVYVFIAAFWGMSFIFPLDVMLVFLGDNLLILNGVLVLSYGFLCSYLFKTSLTDKEILESTIHWANKSSSINKEIEEHKDKIKLYLEENVYTVFDVESLEFDVKKEYPYIQSSLDDLKDIIANENDFDNYDDFRKDFMNSHSYNKNTIQNY